MTMEEAERPSDWPAVRDGASYPMTTAWASIPAAAVGSG